MHSIIHLAERCNNQPPRDTRKTSKIGPEKKTPPVHSSSTSRNSVGGSAVEGEFSPDGGGVSTALLRRGMNLERAVVALAQGMDTHLEVASLQWICLVCFTDLHALDVRVSDFFMVHAGCQILHR